MIESVGEHNCHRHNPKHVVFPIQENSSVVFLSNVLWNVLLYTYTNIFSARNGRPKWHSYWKEGKNLYMYIHIYSSCKRKLKSLPPTTNKTTDNTNPKILRSLTHKTCRFFRLLLAISANLKLYGKPVSQLTSTFSLQLICSSTSQITNCSNGGNNEGANN